jgi:putative membrane protein
MQENKTLAGKLNIIAYVLSAIVLILVGMMRRVKIATDIDFAFLPPINAVVNSLVAVFLVMALYYIKKKNIEKHKQMIFGAVSFSAIFLLGYVLYHFTTEETTFCKDGLVRYLYYFILISHIVLAGISFPFILFTFIRGFTYQVEKHKKMARWVWPVWFYVAITGPITYLFLSPCYN